MMKSKEKTPDVCFKNRCKNLSKTQKGKIKPNKKGKIWIKDKRAKFNQTNKKGKFWIKHKKAKFNQTKKGKFESNTKGQN